MNSAKASERPSAERKCNQPEMEILLSRTDWQSAYFTDADDEGQRSCILIRKDQYIFVEARDGKTLWMEARVPSNVSSDYEFIRYFEPTKGVMKDLLFNKGDLDEKYAKRECGNKTLHFLYGLKIKGIVPIKK